MDIVTVDGWRLDAVHLPAQGRPKGVVVCGHAMFCNRKTLDRPVGQGLGTALAEAGFETLLVDFRGHGKSTPALGPDVDASYDDYVLRDIPAALRAAEAAFPDLPIALLGHSLGAHAGLAALAVDRTLPARALVSLAGNVWIRSLEPNAAVWPAKLATFMVWAAVARAHGCFPARRYKLGTDDEGLSYVLQFLRNARADRWGSIDGRYDYLRLMAHVRIPILSVVGAADTWMCPPRCSKAWLDHAVRADVTHQLVDSPQGVDHMGLLMHEGMRPRWDEIASWIERTLTT